MNQDDPKKCTALKLVRLGLAKKISLRQVSKKALLLNPMSTEIICKTDAKHLNSGLVVIDCSWKRGTVKGIPDIFKKRLPGINKRLPKLPLRGVGTPRSTRANSCSVRHSSVPTG